MAHSLIIDGTEYKVPILKLQRAANVLDKYAERTEDGDLWREVIGTYYNYTLTVGMVHDKTLYNKLFEVLSDPVDYHWIELPHDGVRFQAYASSVQDELLRLERDGPLYTGLTFRFTAKKPRKTP